MKSHPFIMALFVFLFFFGKPLFSQTYSIIVDGGLSQRLFFISDSVPDGNVPYMKSKRTGQNIGIEAVAFNEGHGIGFKFSTFTNRVSSADYKTILFHVKKNETVRINYFCMQYHWRQRSVSLPMYYELCAGLGLLRYKSIGKEDSEQVEILSKSYGMNASLSCEYAILKHFSVGILAGILVGKLVDATRNGYKYTVIPPENNSRADFNLFTRFNF